MPLAVNGLQKFLKLSLVLSVKTTTHSLLLHEINNNTVRLQQKLLLFFQSRVLFQMTTLAHKLIQRTLQTLQSLLPKIRSVQLQLVFLRPKLSL